MEMATRGSKLHIALFPWLAFGHMNPFLQLAIALAKLGHRISFLATPRNVRRLRPNVPDRLLPLVTFVELPLPRVDGLPDDAEATVGLPLDQCQPLRYAYRLLRGPVGKFLAESSPDWIIPDVLASWVGGVAREHGVKAMLFSVFNASTMAFFGETVEARRWCWPSPASMTTKPEWIPFPNSKLAFKKHEAEAMHPMLTSASGQGWTSGDHEAFAVRCCCEIEGEYLDLLRASYTKPVIPVGLLPPVSTCSPDDPQDMGILFLWLDEQRPRSVVFVSFGSEYKLSRTEVQEIAFGLEQSHLPFIWDLMMPLWLAGDDIGDALPAGFLDRTQDRGVVSVGWGPPQPGILAHPSVGGSLFHSGWGSVVETLRYGHVLVLLPFVFDQGINARFLVEKGLGVEVERNEDGSFTGAEVARALTTAMVSDEGEALRNKARDAAPMFADQLLHDEYVKKFADHLLAARNKPDV